MATAEQVLDLSRFQLGNGPEKYTDWYPSGKVAWCMIYQSWLLSESGLPTHYAWVSALFDAMRADGRNTYDVRSAMPGDLIAFEWNSTPGGYDHVAMVESVDANGITSIDGNWGNKVTRVWHSFNTGGIAEIARPSYTAPIPPTPEEDDDMKSLLMIDRRQTPAPVYHAFGNTKVWLSKQEQIDTLRFLGVAVVDPAPPAWLDALATIPRG